MNTKQTAASILTTVIGIIEVKIFTCAAWSKLYMWAYSQMERPWYNGRYWGELTE